MKYRLSIETLIQRKLEKFEKSTAIIRARVSLFTGPGSNSGKYQFEIRSQVPGNAHFSEKNSTGFEKTIANAVDTTQRRMQKAKEKQLDKNWKTTA